MRDGVAVATLLPWVDAQDLSQQRTQIGCRFRRGAAVADRDVEEPVRAELQLPAVVITGIAMSHHQYAPLRGGVGLFGIARATPVFVDLDVTVSVGKGDIEQSGGGIVGSEGD